jgi:hypothetical protein
MQYIVRPAFEDDAAVGAAHKPSSDIKEHQARPWHRNAIPQPDWTACPIDQIEEPNSMAGISDRLSALGIGNRSNVVEVDFDLNGGAGAVELRDDAVVFDKGANQYPAAGAGDFERALGVDFVDQRRGSGGLGHWQSKEGSDHRQQRGSSELEERRHRGTPLWSDRFVAARPRADARA